MGHEVVGHDVTGAKSLGHNVLGHDDLGQDDGNRSTLYTTSMGYYSLPEIDNPFSRVDYSTKIIT